MNSLWLPAWKIHGEIDDSRTIKKCLKDAATLHRLVLLAGNLGVGDLERYLTALAKGDNHNNKK